MRRKPVLWPFLAVFDLEGHPTASGEVFSNQAMTAASQEVALGTRLRVTNLKNGHSAIVRVNDRGVSRRGFIIRVTQRVAEQLDFVNAGSARVKLQVLKIRRLIGRIRKAGDALLAAVEGCAVEIAG